MRYVVTDGAGVILRSGYASNPAEQAGSGETVYVIEGGNGAAIDDELLTIVDGAFVASGGATAPTGDLSAVVEP
jgi:hypothetical protein